MYAPTALNSFLQFITHHLLLSCLYMSANACVVRLWGHRGRKRPSRNNHKLLIAGNYAKIAARPQSPYQRFVRATHAYTTQIYLRLPTIIGFVKQVA